MSKQNILRITLFVSVLAFNPAVAQTNLRPVTTAASLQEQEEERLSVEISDALEAKGLEHEAAREITQLYLGKIILFTMHQVPGLIIKVKIYSMIF